MIPKIIHHIWIGNNPFPPEFSEFLFKWKSMYSDYNFLFWNNELIESSNIIDDSIYKYYYGDYKIAFKADILRFKILNKFGGIYVDTDTEPLKKMPDDFLKYKFFSGIQKPYPEIAIGIMGAEPENELVSYYNKKIIENIELNTDENSVVSDEIWRITGPQYFTQICQPYINNPLYKFFESDFFYPYGWTELHRRYENFSVTCPDAYSVHHWAHSWW